MRSEYIVNGRFVYIIYQMAVEEYELDCKEYNEFKSVTEKDKQQQQQSQSNPQQQGPSW